MFILHMESLVLILLQSQAKTKVLNVTPVGFVSPMYLTATQVESNKGGEFLILYCTPV